MNKSLRQYGLVLLFYILLALLVFRCCWGADMVFSGSDSNIGLITGTHRRLPESILGYYLPTALFGTAGSNGILPLRGLGAWLLPPEVFNDVWYGVYLVLSSLFLVAYLRLWKVHWGACLFGALAAFWVGSITFAAAGHLAKLGVMMLFVLAVLLVEKAVRAQEHIKRLAWSGAAGLATGFMLLEQQDVALLAGLFLGVYTLFRLGQVSLKQPLVWIELLLPIAVIGLVMSASAATKAYKANVTDVALKKDAQKKWDFITQWSMVPEELPDLIAPGYSGWSTGNPNGPYWGECGQSAEWKATGKGFRNFRLDSTYLGILPLVLAIYGAAVAYRSRKEEREISTTILCWAGLGLLALLLSFGKFSPFYKAFYQLPLVGNIRGPIKFLHNFQVIGAILAAFGLDRLLKKRSGAKSLMVAGGGLLGIFMLSAIMVSGDRFSDWGQYAETIAKTTRGAWLHASVLAAVLAGVAACVWKKLPFGTPGRCASILIVALAFDSLMLTKHYFKADDIRLLRKGNVVFDFLKRNQDDERIYFLDSSGIYNRWLAVDVAYHGLNVFNIWQMPRMPQEYKTFLAAVGQNQVRMWQLASVKYVTAPAGILQNANAKALFTPLMYYRFAMQDDQIVVVPIEQPTAKNDQVLLQFNEFIPRFSLYSNWESLVLDRHCDVLFSNTFNPRQTVLVDDSSDVPAAGNLRNFEPVLADTDLRKAVVKTNSNESGVLLFTQRWQPGWRVEIDGEPAELLRCNFLCMGVLVPAGEHEVQFRYN